MSVSIKLRRKDEYYAALRQFIPALEQELKAGMAKAADQFVARAKQYAPVDEGDLRNSIKWDWTRKTKQGAGRVPAIIVQAGAEGRSDPAFYARWVEFGTPTTPKQPFFFPAYRLARRSIRSAMSRAMSRAMKKAGIGK